MRRMNRQISCLGSCYVVSKEKVRVAIGLHTGNVERMERGREYIHCRFLCSSLKVRMTTDEITRQVLIRNIQIAVIGIQRFFSVLFLYVYFVLCNVFTPTRKTLDFKHASQ